jgi:hypothetical protein
MKKYNLWKSVMSGHVYPQDVDRLPKFGGWELVGTIEIPADADPLPYAWARERELGGKPF